MIAHRVVPEKYVQPMNRHAGCKGLRQQVDKASGAMLGGCPTCWSRTTWRWNCSSCDYQSAWVEDNVAANEERAAFDAHRGFSTAATVGGMRMWYDGPGIAVSKEH
jgi:hypothetical protein